MDNSANAPRRERVERNIYRRPTGVFEVGYKDASGKQRWRTVDGGITAARALRDQLIAQRNRGEAAPDNVRLRFGDAADQWLAGPVTDLRQTTRDCYRNAVDNHLRTQFQSRRLDAVTPDDLASLVRDLRGEGLAEATIAIVIGVTNRIYRYAARRLGWVGTNPVSLMLPSERPKPSQAKRRRLFEGTELEETVAAATEPYKTLFTVAALTGARLSELLGLTWANVRLDPVNDAEIEFAHQVDRKGQIRPTKTDESARTIPIPGQLVRILLAHRNRCVYFAPSDFVFATSTRRAISQRNTVRALRAAQIAARTTDGRPTFPVLHETDGSGQSLPAAHGAVPSMHSFRHTVASRALLAGESIDEVAFLLGHRDANVTRAVYVRELSDARRRSMRRSRISQEFAALLDAPGHFDEELPKVTAMAPATTGAGRMWLPDEESVDRSHREHN
jgi:integrase